WGASSLSDICRQIDTSLGHDVGTVCRPRAPQEGRECGGRRRLTQLTRPSQDPNTSAMMARLPRGQVSALCAAVVADCACEGVRRAARAISKVYAGALAGVGLTATQLAILVVIRRHGSLPLTRLAQGLYLDRTSLYRAVGP